MVPSFLLVWPCRELNFVNHKALYTLKHYKITENQKNTKYISLLNRYNFLLFIQLYTDQNFYMLLLSSRFIDTVDS